MPPPTVSLAQPALPANGNFIAPAAITLTATATTAPVTVNVINNSAPTVSLTANPANGTAPATIILNATATDTDGTIAQVEFLNGTNSIATVTQAPYTTNWANVTQGNYSLTAKATDNLGASTTSAAVPVAVTANTPKAYDIHADHLNTPRVITDATGTEVWRWDSAPFGETLPNEQPAANTNKFVFNQRFPGQYYDQETGLHYNYFRDYDPASGRYVQSDPIGLYGGHNTYSYVKNDSLSFYDPLGLMDVYKKDGVTYHAYPKGDGGNETAKHGPHGDYHVHVNGKKEGVVTIDQNGVMKIENPDKLTKSEIKAINQLDGQERKYMRKACREVFHNNGKSLPYLKAKYLGGSITSALMLLTSNSFKETCDADDQGQLDDEVCKGK